MSTWNTDNVLDSSDQNEEKFILVNGEKVDMEDVSNDSLVMAIAEVAQTARINKFDLKDASGNDVDEDDIESGNFEWPLRIVKINTAATATFNLRLAA